MQNFKNVYLTAKLTQIDYYVFAIYTEISFLCEFSVRQYRNLWETEVSYTIIKVTQFELHLHFIKINLQENLVY